MVSGGIGAKGTSTNADRKKRDNDGDNSSSNGEEGDDDALAPLLSQSSVDSSAEKNRINAAMMNNNNNKSNNPTSSLQMADPEDIFQDIVDDCREFVEEEEREDKALRGSEAVTRFHHFVNAFQKLVLYETRSVRTIIFY